MNTDGNFQSIDSRGIYFGEWVQTFMEPASTLSPQKSCLGVGEAITTDVLLFLFLTMLTWLALHCSLSQSKGMRCKQGRALYIRMGLKSQRYPQMHSIKLMPPCATQMVMS